MNMKTKRSRPVTSCGSRVNTRLPRDARHHAFTMIELLVVVGIIAVLIGLLFPVLNRVRAAGDRTRSVAAINNIATAIQAYHLQFKAFPGVYGNNEVQGAATTYNATIPTSSENLVLALSGGLEIVAPNTYPTFNANLLGTGPKHLKTTKQYPPFIEGVKLTKGQIVPTTVALRDTQIPEFDDGYERDTPVLYLRANVGMKGIAAEGLTAQYDASTLYPYTRSMSPGPHGLQQLGLDTDALNKTGLNTVRPYLRSPTLGGSTPRNVDTFILIGAGPDGFYGTADDITNFGEVMP